MLLEMWALCSMFSASMMSASPMKIICAPQCCALATQASGINRIPGASRAGGLRSAGRIADGNRPVVLPPRMGFRSDAFEGEPPQVFETEVEHTIHALKNEWTLGPVRERFPSDELLLEANTAALTAGQLVLLRTRPGPGTTTELQAGRVTSTRVINALDGDVRKREIAPAPKLDPQVELGAIEVLSPRLTASVNPLEKTPIETS